MTSMKIKIGTNIDTGEPVVLDLDYVIEERMEILGGSGSGKSHLLRCICEQTNGKVQQIIISPKKEFVTLREKFNYVHVGTASPISKPDIELNTRYAGQLALKILETGMDAIIEFSENSKDRVKYVRNFIEGLLDAGEHLWHPVMICIDEIDIWAPEKGHGEAESLGTIADLASRGRDKGFFLVAATQRISKFNKDVAAELGVKFIGKATLDNDQTRAAQELGIPSKEKTKLRDLGRPNFHFYAFGPGLSDDVIKIKSLPVQTTHVSGYKRNKMQKPIPTPAKISSMISQFSDLPKEAEKEIKTKEELHKKITELQIRLKQSEKIQPKQDPQVIQNAHDSGYQKGFNDAVKKSKETIDAHVKYIHAIKSNASRIKQILSGIPEKIDHELALILETAPVNSSLPELPKETKLPIHTDIVKSSPAIIQPKTNESTNSLLVDSNISGPEKIILTAIAQRNPQEATKQQISIVSGYSIKSSGFNNNLAHLNSNGLIQRSNGIMKITEAGLQALGPYDPLETDPERLLDFWCDKLGNSCGKILRAICEAYPNSITKEEVAEKSNYSITSSGFNNNLAKLNSSNLIERLGPGELKASKEMFP